MTLYYLNGERSLILLRQEDGYVVEDQPAALETRVVSVSGQINGSLFASTDALGIPDTIVKQMVEIFSTEIDFHRGLRRDDRFTVIYEALHDRGDPMGGGRLLAAEFVNRGKKHNIMWFEPNPDRPGGGGALFHARRPRYPQGRVPALAAGIFTHQFGIYRRAPAPHIEYLDCT